MPTYRQNKVDGTKDGKEYSYGFPFLNNDNILKLDSFCKDNKMTLVLKWHGLQNCSACLQTENIVFVTSDDLAKYDESLNSFLSISDALITDYSSVFINYLLLNMPICFAYDDMEFYKNNRGFMFDDIESCMPGFKAESFESLLDFLTEISHGIDSTKSTRIDKLPFFNKYMDNQNSLRLLKYLGII